MQRCDRCGKDRDDVTYTQNPYIYDIYGEVVYEDLCQDCLEDLRGSV